MKTKIMHTNLKLKRGQPPIIDSSITYEELERLPLKDSVLVFKEYFYLLLERWEQLPSKNRRLASILSEYCKIDQMEHSLPTTQSNLYLLMVVEDIKQLIRDTHYIPFDQRYLKMPPKPYRKVKVNEYYKDLKREYNKQMAETQPSKAPVKTLGTRK